MWIQEKVERKNNEKHQTKEVTPNIDYNATPHNLARGNHHHHHQAQARVEFCKKKVRAQTTFVMKIKQALKTTTIAIIR